MPANFARLKKLLEEKRAFIERQQETLERLLLKKGQRFANDLALIIGRGFTDEVSIATALDTLGYSEEVLTRVGKIQPLLDFAALIAEAQGISFLLSKNQQAELEAFIIASETALTTGFRTKIVDDMQVFAINARLAQLPFETIKREAEEILEPIGRRAAVEVATGIATFDRAVMSSIYENANIELFVYFPPTLIEGASRDSCIRAVNDPRQKTGWTREQINKDPELDFIKGGKPYYNCRHEWIAFREGAPL